MYYKKIKAVRERTVWGLARWQDHILYLEQNNNTKYHHCAVLKWTKMPTPLNKRAGKNNPLHTLN